MYKAGMFLWMHMSLLHLAIPSSAENIWTSGGGNGRGLEKTA
jgi:hypothetical protein